MGWTFDCRIGEGEKYLRPSFLWGPSLCFLKYWVPGRSSYLKSHKRSQRDGGSGFPCITRVFLTDASVCHLHVMVQSTTLYWPTACPLLTTQTLWDLKLLPVTRTNGKRGLHLRQRKNSDKRDVCRTSSIWPCFLWLTERVFYVSLCSLDTSKQTVQLVGQEKVGVLKISVRHCSRIYVSH